MLKLKRVRRYKTPAYPVVDSGDVLFIPRELRLPDIGRWLVRPVAPLAITMVVAQGSQAISQPTPRPAPVSQLDRPAGPTAAVTQDKKTFRPPIRRLTESEVKELIGELKKVETQRPHPAGGIRAPGYVQGATEEQAGRLLHRFFAKNGIELRKDVAFKKSGVSLKLDGYDRKTGIGFEYIPPGGERDITQSEAKRLAKGIRGEHLMVLDGRTSRPPRGSNVASFLQNAAEEFLLKLHKDGAIPRWKEIEEALRGLRSKDRKTSEAAADTLARIGVEALVWIDQMNKSTTNEDYQSRLDLIAARICDKEIKPLFKQLDSDNWKVRDEATRKLKKAGPPIYMHVKRALEEAVEDGNVEVADRCRQILKAIR